VSLKLLFSFPIQKALRASSATTVLDILIGLI